MVEPVLCKEKSLVRKYDIQLESIKKDWILFNFYFQRSGIP